MGTSGVTSLTMTRNEIIEEALSMLRRLGIGETLQAEDANTCAKTLNMMIQQWQMNGINISTVRDITVFLDTDKTAYLLGPQGDNAAEAYLSAAVATAGAIGDSTLVLDSGFTDVDAIALAQNASKAWHLVPVGDYRYLHLDGNLSASGIARMPEFPCAVTITSDADESGNTFTVTGIDVNGELQIETITGPVATTATGTAVFSSVNTIKYPEGTALVGNVSAGYSAAFRHVDSEQLTHYGIVQDDETIHWDSLTFMTPFTESLETASLNAPLTAIVSEGNPVFSYHEKIDRPLDILSARLISSTGQETPLTRFGSKLEYLRVGNKSATGVPNAFWYNPTLDNGTLHLYPMASDVSNVLQCQAKMPIEIMSDSSSTAPFPQEWASALIYNLAILIAPKFGAIPDESVIHFAGKFLRDAKQSQVKTKSLQFIPKLRR